VILYSHILKIVIEKEINIIPDKYFLDIWRKNDMKVHVERQEEETVVTSSLLRFKHIIQEVHNTEFKRIKK